MNRLTIPFDLEKQNEATTEQVGNFKKAFGVCLEAKDYVVK